MGSPRHPAFECAPGKAVILAKLSGASLELARGDPKYRGHPLHFLFATLTYIPCPHLGIHANPLTSLDTYAHRVRLSIFQLVHLLRTFSKSKTMFVYHFSSVMSCIYIRLQRAIIPQSDNYRMQSPPHFSRAEKPSKNSPILKSFLFGIDPYRRPSTRQS